MPTLTPDEHRRLESDVVRAEHDGVEVTTPPSPFRIGEGIGDVDTTAVEVGEIGTGENIASSVSSRLAMEEGKKVRYWLNKPR